MKMFWDYKYVIFRVSHGFLINVLETWFFDRYRLTYWNPLRVFFRAYFNDLYRLVFKVSSRTSTFRRDTKFLSHVSELFFSQD